MGSPYRFATDERLTGPPGAGIEVCLGIKLARAPVHRRSDASRRRRPRRLLYAG